MNANSDVIVAGQSQSRVGNDFIYRPVMIKYAAETGLPLWDVLPGPFAEEHRAVSAIQVMRNRVAILMRYRRYPMVSVWDEEARDLLSSERLCVGVQPRVACR